MRWTYPLVEISDLVSSVKKWNPRQSKTNELINYMATNLRWDKKGVSSRLTFANKIIRQRCQAVFKAGYEFGKISFRRLAQKTKLSKSSAHRLYHRIARRNQHPESSEGETEKLELRSP